MSLASLSPSLAAEATGEITLEEVTVTAQRREENLQRVPIAVATVTADIAEDRGATDLVSLGAAIPNIYITPGLNTHTYIRGIGSANATPNNEPSAAAYIDGVYQPSPYGLSGSFNNIAQIAVLKGPQGTLFGRNTTSGVIQFTTPEPQHQTAGNVTLGYANFQALKANAYLTGGITGNLAADISVLYEDQTGGWGINVTDGTEANGIERDIMLRSKWLYTPSDATSFHFSFDYSNVKTVGGIQMMPGSFAFDGVSTYTGRWNTVGESDIIYRKQHGASVRVEHDFSATHLVSITSYRRVYGFESRDNDRSPIRRSYLEITQDSDYGTQELLLSNRNPGRVTWQTGIFAYGNVVGANEPRLERGTSVNPNGFREVRGRQRSRSYSAFAQTTAGLTDATKLTVGLRYTSERLVSDGSYRNILGQEVQGSPFTGELKSTPWTWRLALDHQFTDDILGYVSYNRGFKSGGFNTQTPNAVSFKPETLDAYEIGLKSEFMDHRLRLNSALFYYSYKDMQVTINPGGVGQLFTNAGKSRVYGIDAGLDFAATERLTLSTGLGAVDAKYVDYPNAQTNDIRGVTINVANAKGYRLANAPPLTAYANASYRLPTSIGSIKLAANLSYTDAIPQSVIETPRIRTHFLLSASAEWSPTNDDSLAVKLWGRNLTNAYYQQSIVISTLGWYGGWSEPRTYGVELSKKF